VDLPATAVDTAGPDGHAWADVAAARLGARKSESSSDSSPGFDPPPLFPPDDRGNHPLPIFLLLCQVCYMKHRRTVCEGGSRDADLPSIALGQDPMGNPVAVEMRSTCPRCARPTCFVTCKCQPGRSVLTRQSAGGHISSA
jgi:hypothetical protein